MWILKEVRYRTNRRNPALACAWRDIDVAYGDYDASDPRALWNHEQATRRALRSLAKRGLVQLGRYHFRLEADRYVGDVYFPGNWEVIEPARYIPGKDRIMTGVRLTDAGWEIAPETLLDV
jgi:hypothetical protein